MRVLTCAASQVVEMLDLKKYYALDGGERVHALRGISLHSTSEFYPILAGEFVMVGRCALGHQSMLDKLSPLYFEYSSINVSYMLDCRFEAPVEVGRRLC
jgi:hypothetical protein